MFRKVLLSLVLASTTVFAADPVTERPDISRTPTASVPTPTPTQAPAPIQAAQNHKITVPGSVWIGTEQFNNNGRLEFGLRSDGTAVMVDARSNITGRWTTQGNDIVVTFKNCVYRGTIEGNDLVGRATFTTGKEAGQSWTFRIAHVNPYAGREFNGQESLNGGGTLTFRFAADGSVIMVDARSQVRGTYTYDVGQLRIRFVNCEYSGTIQNDNTFAGTARPTDGTPAQPWTFSVRLK